MADVLQLENIRKNSDITHNLVAL